MFKSKFLSFICFALISFSSLSYAQAVKNGTSYFRLIDAYTQRTIPGIKEAEPITKSYFLIVWRKTTPPGPFFWRGANGWQGCSIQKAHKPIKKNKITGPQYTLEQVRAREVKKGDTLLITAAPGGKYPIPAVIPQSTTNTLFFKIDKNEWLKYPVKKMDKKPDVIMP